MDLAQAIRTTIDLVWLTCDLWPVKSKLREVYLYIAHVEKGHSSILRATYRRIVFDFDSDFIPPRTVHDTDIMQTIDIAWNGNTFY